MKSNTQNTIEKKIGEFVASLLAAELEAELVAIKGRGSEEERDWLASKLELCTKDRDIARERVATLTNHNAVLTGFHVKNGALRDLLQVVIDKEQPLADAGHHGLLNAMEAAQEGFRARLSVLETMHNLKDGKKLDYTKLTYHPQV